MSIEKRKSVRAVRLVRTGRRAQKTGAIPSDVQGSYTGVPRSDEMPVQDVDDL